MTIDQRARCRRHALVRLRYGLLCWGIGGWLCQGRVVAQAVQTPPGARANRTIEFVAHEGTFVAVDVAPNGQQLVFDLLGHLYTLPIEGGTATPITSGQAWDRAPRFSPDGRWIAFVRDGPGADNVWVMPAGGGLARPVTQADSAPWVSGTPAWTPDGQAIAFGQHGMSSRLHVVDVARGTLRPVEEHVPISADSSVRGKGSVAIYSGTFSPDGRVIYFSETHSLWDERLNHGAVARTMLVRLMLGSQQRTVLTDTTTGVHEFMPRLSRDGRWLGYVRREASGRSALRVRELASGADRELMVLPDEDEPFRWSDYMDERPAYAFTPDAQFLVLSAGGHLHKVSVANGGDQVIPFTARVARTLPPLARPHVLVSDGPLAVRGIRWPTLALERRTLVFSAVGYLWIQDMHGGRPRRLTGASPDHFELMPALSPDGRRVAYIDFERAGDSTGPGRLMVMPVTGGTPRVVVEDRATYFVPSWSPDGRKLAFVRESQDAIVGLQPVLSNYFHNTGFPGAPRSAAFGWVDLRERMPRLLAPAPPHTIAFEATAGRLVAFSADGEHLLMSWHAEKRSAVLRTIRLDGHGAKTLALGGAEVRGLVPSPDARHAVLLGPDEEAWITTLSPQGVSTKGPPIQVSFGQARRISRAGANYVVWRGSSAFSYGFANRVYEYTLGGAAGRLVHSVRLTVPRHTGTGMVAFTNARLITVSGDTGAGRVIERGTLLMKGRRIVAVGPTDSVSLPLQAHVVDASGLTLMPGLIDVHYHTMEQSARLTPLLFGRLGLPQSLAYGVTTGWDATGGPNDGPLALAELREAGRVLGPRWYYAQVPVAIDHHTMSRTYMQAVRVAERRRDMGVVLLKEYEAPRRDERQWFAEAARALGMGIASHTEGLDQVLSRAADGYTGVDHPNMAAPVYEDVRQFLAAAGTIWTPDILTIAAGTASASEEDAARGFLREVFRRMPDERSKLARFVDSERVASYTAVSPRSPMETHAGPLARAAAYLMRGGVKVAISAHNPPSIMTQGEMWLLQQGGASPAEIIRAATMIGAEKIGIQQDVGSLEPGKIADLLVLTANPLDDILHTLALKYTVADGIVYDSHTLEVLWPRH